MSLANFTSLRRAKQIDGYVLCEEGRVSQCLAKVFALEIPVVIKDGFARLAGRQQAEQSRDWKPQPANAGLASADGRSIVIRTKAMA